MVTPAVEKKFQTKAGFKTIARLNHAIARLACQDFAAAETDYRELQKSGVETGLVCYGLAAIAGHRHDTNQEVNYLRLCLTNTPPGTPSGAKPAPGCECSAPLLEPNELRTRASCSRLNVTEGGAVRSPEKDRGRTGKRTCKPVEHEENKKTPTLVADKNPNGESRLGWKVGQRKQIEPERKEL